MMDFRDVIATSKDEQIRAWAVEKAVENNPGASGALVVNVAQMIEAYIKTGEDSSELREAVEEGVREGRFEVLEMLKERFPTAELSAINQIFIELGWAEPRATPGR